MGIEKDSTDWLVENEKVSIFDPDAPVEYSVIGADERTRVDNTLLQPFRWVCQLIGFSSFSGSARKKAGTAFVIGRRTLLTAGHNLWIGDRPAARFYLYPGLDGDRATPALGSYELTTAIPHPAYANSRDDRFDAAVLVLNDPLPSHLTNPQYGALPWTAVDPTKLTGHRGLVSGYPLHQPRSESTALHDRQYFSTAPLQYRDGQLFYLADTTKGQSGSPLLVAMTDANGDLRSTAVGIHVQGGDNVTGNGSVAIGAELASFVRQQLEIYEPRGIA